MIAFKTEFLFMIQMLFKGRVIAGYLDKTSRSYPAKTEETTIQPSIRITGSSPKIQT